MSSANRYHLEEEIGAGGMARVYLGRLAGPVGFARTVAIKCLRPELAGDPEFVEMFLDEARLAAKIHHPNVVPTIDVVIDDDATLIVMEYVQGAPLSFLLKSCAKKGQIAPLAITSSIMVGALEGLHAAHETRDESGRPLGIVHRDISPQNVLVGEDGVARLVDFGVAKAAGRATTTRDGQIKGKLRYMAPEQLQHGSVDRRADIYAATAVLWEMLTGRRLIDGDSEGQLVLQVVSGGMRKPSELNPAVPAALDAIVARGLSLDPAARFATAREMAVALEEAVPPARARGVAEWVRTTAEGELSRRARAKAQVETRIQSARAEPEATVAGVDTTGLSTPKSSRGRTLLVAGALAALVAGGALVLRELQSSSTEARSESPPVAAASSVASVAEPAPPASASASTPPLASSAPPMASTPASVISKPPPRAPLAKEPPAPKKEPACNPPYVIDAKGVKSYKRECL